jgi:hypothetical protein
MTRSHRSASRSRLTANSGEDARAHEDLVDLIEAEFGATVVAAWNYDERARADRRDARTRESQR